MTSSRALIFCLVLTTSGYAQRPLAEALRPAYERIAARVADTLAQNHVGRLSIVVEGTSYQRLAENAFLEAVQERGAVVQNGQFPVLRILVLQELREGDGSEREPVVELEARWETGADGTVRYLGRFHSGLGREPGMVERMLGPLVVITGAVLIVYLLFTVRS